MAFSTLLGTAASTSLMLYAHYGHRSMLAVGIFLMYIDLWATIRETRK